MKVPPVIVGVDGSPPSRLALRWAGEYATAHRLPLLILFAGNDYRTGMHALDESHEAVIEDYPDLPCHTIFSRKRPASALIAASAGASLLVVGSRGHGAFHDLILGSTSMHTAMHAHCPVAVVRQHRCIDAEDMDRIVVAVDTAAEFDGSVWYAFQEADLAGKPVTAVQVIPAPEAEYPVAAAVSQATYDAAVHALGLQLAPWLAAFPRVSVEIQVMQMPAATALVHLSKGAHLTVVGASRMGGAIGLFTSAGQALIHHAGSPVVVTRR